MDARDDEPVAATAGTGGERRADVVLEGGGVKGIGLLGALVELADRGWGIERVAGTSAGAIVGALAAGYTAAGRPLADIIEVMNSLDYAGMRDGTTLDRLGFPGKALQLLLSEGIYKGDVAAEWIAAELAKVGVRTWADLRLEDPDSSLEPYQQYRLVIMASDLSRGQLVRLPWDYRRYGLDPDEQPVAEAVRASMSIPFFFRPVTLKTGPGGGGDVTLVDGGMLSNFPVETFDRTDGRVSRWPTFGIKLSARADSRQRARHVDGPIDLAMACLHTLLQAHDAYHLEDTGVTQRTMFVDTEGISSVDFGIDLATRERLFANGRAAAGKFLGRIP